MKISKLQWSQQEISLLKELIPLFSSKKWKNISRIFKQKGFQRTQTECRQKWVNFFNPRIKRQQWSQQELRILYESYQKHKTQWYLIEKLLIGRTQNKIKNRFYGTLRNFVRFIVRFFNKNSKSYSTEINKLSPKYLNMIYQSQDMFQFLNGEIPQVIKELGYLFDRNQFSKRVKEKREMYFELFEKIVQIFDSKMSSMSQQENQESQEIRENSISQNVERIQNKQENVLPQYPIYSNHQYMFPTYYFYFNNGFQ